MNHLCFQCFDANIETIFTQSEFYEVLQSKFGDNCGYRLFDDMQHGFSGARGDFSNPLIRERVDEVITKLGIFFDRNLNEFSYLHD